MDSYDAEAPARAPSTPLHVSYFLNFYDEQFVWELYAKLLNRKPDVQGNAYYLSLVRAGVSRYEIVSNIASSREFASRKVPLAGMKSYRVYRSLAAIPVLGRFVQGVVFLFNIETFLKDLRALENHVYRLSVHIEQEKPQ